MQSDPRTLRPESQPGFYKQGLMDRGESFTGKHEQDDLLTESRFKDNVRIDSDDPAPELIQGRTGISGHLRAV